MKSIFFSLYIVLILLFFNYSFVIRGQTKELSDSHESEKEKPSYFSDKSPLAKSTFDTLRLDTSHNSYPKVLSFPMDIKLEPRKKTNQLVLKDVIYTGYYRLKIKAKNVDRPQNPVGYRLFINNEKVYYVSSSNGTVSDSDEYIDHGLHLLKKGESNFIYIRSVGEDSIQFNEFQLISPPHIYPEPEFTKGTSNSIKFIISEQSENLRVVAFNPLLSDAYIESGNIYKTGDDTSYTAEFIRLLDAKQYQYFIKVEDDNGYILRSDTTSTTQDASPPSDVNLDTLRTKWQEPVLVQLLWKHAKDSVSGVNYYNLIRSTDRGSEIVAKIMYDAVTEKVFYEDTLFNYNSNENYKYSIVAFDKAGNSKLSPAPQILPKILPPPKLSVDTSRTIVFIADSFHYVQCTDTTAVLPLEASYIKQNFTSTPKSVRYRVIRDSLINSGQKNFYSPWLDFPEQSDYNFDLTNGGSIIIENINNLPYRVSANFRDFENNESADSESLSIIPDCYPPKDIPSLSTEEIFYNDDMTQGWVRLRWGATEDDESGLDNYIVYRKKQYEPDSCFSKIADTGLDTFYVDEFDYQGKLVYRIGSVDKVDHVFDYTQTDHEIVVAAKTSPAVKWLNWERIVNGVRYTTRDFELLIIDLSNFNLDMYQQKVVQIDLKQNDQTKPLQSWNADTLGPEITVPIPLKEEGSFTVRVNMFLNNTINSLWAVSDTIIKTLQIPDSDLAATQLSTDENAFGNYPNPFNSGTRITFNLEAAGHVNVDIYNVQGRKVKTLVNAYREKGMHAAHWYGKDSFGNPVASGIYYFRVQLSSDDKTQQKLGKMLLIK
ncbi:MAG: FlgD immunoglobulin-like domain containing protein [candidate division KSB1 bacterium]|nr:FlgD immunoglobulin-like domain containing protein [candidate division KSB1 bacterium]